MGLAVTRDPRFDILFEPVRIGPVVAKNRFYQVPHCNGMGYARPRAHAAMRGVKGRRRLGGRKHRGGGNPSLERYLPLHRRPTVG